MTQAALFPALFPPFATGFAYEPDFLSVDDEQLLLGCIRELPLTNAQYKEFQAKRRVISYGGRYDYGANELRPGAGIPEFLLPLRARVASWAGRPAEDFTHA